MSRHRPFSMLFGHNGLTGAAPAARPEAGARPILRRLRKLTRQAEDVIAERPLEVLALASAASFALGALAGSRLTRIAAVFGAGVLASSYMRRTDVSAPASAPGRRIPIRRG